MERPFVEQLEDRVVEKNSRWQRVADFFGPVTDLLGVYFSGLKSETNEGIDFRDDLNPDDKRKVDADRLGVGPWF